MAARNMERWAKEGNSLAGNRDLTFNEVKLLTDMCRSRKEFKAISMAFGIGVKVGMLQARKG